ncbi:hypothetical protein ES705_30884 [subsurface metagenome]
MKKLIFIVIISIFFKINGFGQVDKIDTIAAQYSWPEWWFGTVDVLQLESKYVDETYDISIYLPPSYYHTQKIYPVLVMTDAFYTFGIAHNSADLLTSARELPEIIIIGIGFKGKNMVDYIKKRARDFTHSKITGFSTSGGAENFYKFISKELIPGMANKYRIDSNDKALCGNSFGGQFAAYVLLEHTDFFCRYIIGSPSYYYDINLIQTIKIRIGELKNEKLTVYTFVGEKETGLIELWNEFNNVIINNQTDNFRFMHHIVQGKSHSSVFLSEFSTALEWIYNQEK